ncbi:MAG: hypothetical protein ACYCQI_10750 [Gammaproteobacteria bacterium]
MFSQFFQKCYLNNLSDNYSLFYDDFHEYGNRESAEHAIYFIPGLNGTPGQVRLAMPAIKKNFGHKLYIKCLYLDEFSANRPVWEKYTLINIEKKALKIISDVTDLLKRFKKINLFVSSNGFYDFANAYAKELHKYKNDIILFWVACAPHKFNSTPWHKVFYPINGFQHNGFEWVAFPNIDIMKVIHKETDTKFQWNIKQQKKSLYKVDLESRFRCLNFLWFYASIDCFNACTAYSIRNVSFPLDMTCYILAADRDGYWDHAPVPDMEKTLNDYVKNPKILFKKASHLWVAVPNNVDALLNLAIEAGDITI